MESVKNALMENFPRTMHVPHPSTVLITVPPAIMKPHATTVTMISNSISSKQAVSTSLLHNKSPVVSVIGLVPKAAVPNVMTPTKDPQKIEPNVFHVKSKTVYDATMMETVCNA